MDNIDEMHKKVNEMYKKIDEMIECIAEEVGTEQMSQEEGNIRIDILKMLRKTL